MGAQALVPLLGAASAVLDRLNDLPGATPHRRPAIQSLGEGVALLSARLSDQVSELKEAIEQKGGNSEMEEIGMNLKKM